MSRVRKIPSESENGNLAAAVGICSVHGNIFVHARLSSLKKTRVCADLGAAPKLQEKNELLLITATVR
jgi:hypothetical protein